MIKRYVMAVVAGLAGIGFFAAGCGSAGSSDTADSESSVLSYWPIVSYPDHVIVYRPGMVDTSLTIDDVPDWPGPAPSEFLEPHYPSGEVGVLTGQDMRIVFDTALEHHAVLKEGQAPNALTGALWAAEGVVQWLVVDPQW